MRRKRKPKILRPAELTEDQILAWADAYHKLTGRWPTQQSVLRAVPGASYYRWDAIDLALRRGYRGLPGGSSIARLLAARRGKRNEKALPKFTVAQILRWCDDFHKRTGFWPHHDTAPGEGIPGSHGDTWTAVDSALTSGHRGLHGGSSLARVLAEHRGVPNPADRTPLTVEQILAWADAWHERTGHWPKHTDRPAEIPGAPDETWGRVMTAMEAGLRGLRAGFTFADLLAERRGVRNVARLPPLTVQQVLAWADAFRATTGRWPTPESSPQDIPGAPGERWHNVNMALREGRRGLPGRSSLAQLLAKYRGARNHMRLPRLTVKQILGWADAHHARTGAWPTATGAPQFVEGAPNERWSALDHALRNGNRGLPGGSSLPGLLAEYRGVRNTGRLPGLTVKQILGWADAYRARTGTWPTARCPRPVIPGTDGERWSCVDDALRRGTRGLPGESSLAKLLARHRGVPNLAIPMSARMAGGG